MSDVDKGINAHLAAEVERLENDLAFHKQVVANQAALIQGRDALTQHVANYLPQLTNMSTNLSYVASALQANNAVLDRIAKVLESKVSTPPVDRKAVSQHRGKVCHCDGPPHPYSPGWCPTSGPKI